MKMSKKIISIACAALMASQAMAFNAAAVNQDYYYYFNGKYYTSFSDAATVAGGAQFVESVPTYKVSAGLPTVYYSATQNKTFDSIAAAQAANAYDANLVYVGTYNSTIGTVVKPEGYYYSLLTRKYYTSYADALAASAGDASYVTTNYSYGYGKYYSYYTGKFYDTYAAALAASNNNSSYVTSNYYYNGYYYGHYYSSYTGKYYSTYADALAASNNNSSYVTAVGSSHYPYYYYGTSSNYIYKYYYNGVYYSSLQDAKKAGGTALGVDIFYTPASASGATKYFYYYNGTYYGSLDAAKAAGGTSLGVDISYVPYGYYGYAGNYYYNGYYNNGYYYGYYGDPYYAYRQILNNSTSTSTKTAEDGEPYIYGKKTKAGWDTIIKYINAASKGSTITVDMNGANIVDKDVLEALDGKNVNVTFVLESGVKWTINGKDVDSAKDLIIYTEYNIDYIPNKLVSKAGKNSVAAAQIGVSTDFNSFGSEATITVKFGTKRAGCTAVVYRYNPDNNSLKGVCKSKVLSNGSCSFTAEAGGPYLVVLK